MDAVILILLLVLFGVGIGIAIANIWHTHQMIQLLMRLNITPDQLRKAKENIQQELAELNPSNTSLPVVEITVEQHHGQLFAYRDGSFLAQADTVEHLIARIAERLNGVTLRILSGQGAEIVKALHPDA